MKNKINVDPQQFETKMLTHLNNGVGDFWTGNDRVCVHHSVGVLLSDFRNQEGTHVGTSSSPK